MKFIDLFAGVGGFHLGLTKASKDYVCVYANEWNKYANSIYKKHFGQCDIRDITKVEAREIPDFDLLVGGFPCQSFSIAGKRAGFRDTRGTMFFEIARIVAEKRPRYLLLENVKGLLSHDEGRTFATIIYSLDELGYDLQWQVLNSKNFGVPQNRERVFIVGHIRGESRPEIFPITEGSSRNFEPQREAQGEGERIRSNDTSIIVGALRVGGGDTKDLIATTLAARDHKGGGNLIQLGVQVDSIIRRLTPIECERLQGFPDNWTEGISDSQRYKCLGNAVTVNVVQYIGELLINKEQ